MKCNICKSEIGELINFGNLPIIHSYDYNRLFPLALGICKECGLVQLIDPISPKMLYTNYNSPSQWKYTPHTDELINLIKGLTAEKSSILEIGSGDGFFLKRLKDEGYENIAGIEPANDNHKLSLDKGIRTIHSYFDKKTTNKYVKEQGKCDFLIMRHVLEHIQNLDEFGDCIKLILKNNSYILIEVPDFQLDIDELDYSNIWEEHVNYFTFETLNNFINRIGIYPIKVKNFIFSGKSLLIIGRFSNYPNNILSPSKSYFGKVHNFADNFSYSKQKFNSFLADYKKTNKKVALYGIGHRGSMVLNLMEIWKYIDYIIDDQKERQNKLINGIKVYPSSILDEEKIDLCILAVNYENEDAVINKHLGYKGDYISVCAPSNIFFK